MTNTPTPSPQGDVECENCGTGTSSPICLEHSGERHVFCCYGCIAQYVDSKRRGVENPTQRSSIIQRIESMRNSKVITMIHSAEHDQNHPQYITEEDAESVLYELRNTPDDKHIDLLLHCPGGLVFPAEQIALAIKERKGPTTVIVPYYAMSGATLIAISAKEILMDRYAILGPLDPQVQGLPSASLLKIKEIKKPDYIRDEVLVAIDIASKSASQMKGFIRHLLNEKLGVAQSEKVAEFLTGGYMTHDRPITAKEASAIGLPVKVGIPDDFYNLLRFYRLSRHNETMYSRSCPCL